MMNFNIRKANESDIQSIREIALLTWPVAYGPILEAGQLNYMLNLMYSPDVLSGQINEPNHHILLVHNRDKDIGFAAYSPTEEKDVWKLHKIYVLPYGQKKGAGKLLLQTIENQLKEIGCTRLILNVNKANPAANFYKNMGYTIIDSVKGDIGKGFYMDDYIMQKLL